MLVQRRRIEITGMPDTRHRQMQPLDRHNIDARYRAEGLAGTLRQWVGEQIGPIARPRDVYIVGELPKTRSGKIMRRLLRDVAEGREIGDTTTLADTMVMSVISAQVS